MDNFGFQGIFEWVKTQGQYGLMIILIVVILVCAVKRAWIGMIGAIVGLAAVGIFIVNPDIIKDISEWFSSLLNIS